MIKKMTLAMGALALASSFGVAAQQMDPALKAMLDSSFEAKGIAKKDRIYPDEVQALCSDQAYFNSPEGQKKAIALQEAQLKAIKPPSDGKYLGDWKAGEKVAQSGRGMTWRDSLDKPNGGSCYNCHQVTKEEISYGTIGPSLLGYGKLRGNSKEIIEYTWNRINNSKAYNLCSNMPRFAHFNILTEQQIKDVMALLLDPNSPVNQ
ncbi:sulfur oxidation c-type cytochrome SoxX [Orrella daihaiensis]|uniref:Sulfur oxidation c-type cytochrome SoxX n=1 Tax=Orrella daihaiensis TaxID=2782176 RepID=A0ABY4AHL0_9BURK|nr:sulfur oxidation c-type cytochrome SoxX [Orrella daihaiensis]UOD49674.1 sulfur oxidation c-type cytochrome SoxX [Orrella daihaiensis]